MKTIAFFNNKGGVGKTSLVYHLAWMFADKGLRVLTVDLDPQANLTTMFLTEERLEELWTGDKNPHTILGAILPIQKGIGDIKTPHVEEIDRNLGLVPGDLSLSLFEDKLSESWPKCLDNDEASFRRITAFYRIVEQGASADTDIALIDVGPNLGAINRTALIASDFVCMPLAPDLFSLQGLKNLGPTLRTWRSGWTERLKKAPHDVSMPKGTMSPLGYIVMQHSIRDSRPVKAYQKWMDRIPGVFREAVLEQSPQNAPDVMDDPHNLALLKNYRSLMPMAMDAHKPMFFLKPSDGAIGAHTYAVKDCYKDFLGLAKKIAKKAEIPFAGSRSNLGLR